MVTAQRFQVMADNDRAAGGILATVLAMSAPNKPLATALASVFSTTC